MGKQQNWFLITCVYLFLSLASQIHSTSHTHFEGIGSSSETRHFNGIRRLNVPSLQTTISSVTQQERKENDLIKKLPGQPSVSFKQYGGYVTVDKSATRHLYYYFVEALNANASTPLVLWLNGGPGCSSLEGAFTEHGPFRVHSDGKTLYRNPYSWNNEANVLYLESPTLVGFSYLTAPKDAYLSNFVKRGDKLTAEDNYAFLVNWLERFPEYKGREFYITGESYAGHYCPQLAHIITQRNNQTFINLKGVFIGNPSLDEVDEKKGEEQFLIGHAVYQEDTIIRFDKLCANRTTREQATACYDEADVVNNLKKSINQYSIYTPLCLNSTLTSEPRAHTTVLHYDPCSEAYMTAYLNREDVQGAMHANTTKLPYPWSQCNIDQLNVDWSQKDRAASVLPILGELLRVGVRVMVYSGDTDSAVPFTSTRYVLKKFNQKLEKAWRPWFSEGQVGGYVEEYKNNFTFATVKGAGHMVPSDKPVHALTLFTSFIRNTVLPHFS